ncbi:MAG: hypothetical protein NTZ74_07095 [Chloroflexi bacterium]|nr:hypothetical protein [Chloroflexota bacterium]
MNLPNAVFDLIFPKGTSEWFEIKEGRRNDEDTVTYFTLEEKDIPPLTDKMRDKEIIARKFHEIIITDFPRRGRRTLITFRRRYWNVEGEEKYLKRNTIGI